MTSGRYASHALNVHDARCEVVVRNVGTVYSGPDEAEAHTLFDTYVALSLAGTGRAGDESVTLLVDGWIERQFVGALDIVDGWREAGFSSTDARRHARFDDWGDYPPEFKRRLIQLVEEIDW